MQQLTTSQIVLILFIIFILSNNAEAGTPVVSISASVSPSEIEAGSSGMLTVTVSETGGNDWIKNPTVVVQASSSEGISFSQTSKTVSRIDKSSSSTFYFNFNIEKTVSPGARNMQISLQYYEMDLLNIETYGPYYKSSTATFNIRPTVGVIEITSSPFSAEVYLDGTYKGITPLTISKVQVGSHIVVLKKSGYNELSKSITINSGQTTYVSESLTIQTGTINVESKPVGLEVYLDGIYKGTTPITIPNIPIGSHTVVLKKNGYNDVSKSITVSSGQIAYVSESLTVQAEAAGIKSEPSSTYSKKNEYSDAFGLFEPLIAGFVILFLVGIVYWNKKQKTKSAVVPTKRSEDEAQIEYITKPKEGDSGKTNENTTINVKSAYEYKGAKVYYKIKIENNTSETFGDIKVHLFVPDVFLLKEKEKSISMLEPKEGKTVTFEIRPTGECGDCNVSGKIDYYDYATKGRKMLDIEARSLSVICPVLKRKEIEVKQWEQVTDELIKAEENIKELSVPAENLFNITSRVIKDSGMFMLKPEVTSNPQLFNGIAMFYAEGVTGLRYAAYIEVVGGSRKSRLILKVWAEKEEALTGFYHRILDEIEKRIDVKIFIDDAIVQQHIHIGDSIGTQVKDSFVQRSNIGADTRKCPDCGREVEANEKFCLECGAKL